MHELCRVRIGNYDNFHSKQAIYGEMVRRKFCKQNKIWHLLRGIALWTIMIERNDKVFNLEEWHESKVKHRIWDELIMYAKATYGNG
jgi:hypothetical protein